ncbi:MAG: hypothetical protein KJ062_22405 [Thermoanaerobaculia bacterium]|nr:hypothetical protein [Thermoanaerobaculia bacterium]
MARDGDSVDRELVRPAAKLPGKGWGEVGVEAVGRRDHDGMVLAELLRDEPGGGLASPIDSFEDEEARMRDHFAFRRSDGVTRRAPMNTNSGAAKAVFK